MNETIKFWMDYFGGVDVLYCMLMVLACTQLWKMLLRSIEQLSGDAVRPMPYVFGAFCGLVLIDFTSRGAMVGVVAGMLSSLGYFIVMSYLERDDAPAWQKAIAERVAIK